MGLLDQVMSAVGGTQGGQQQGLMAGLMKTVNSPSVGGIGGLLSKLQAGGMGGQLQSWIGTGANQPVTGQQLTDALGHDQINEVAREAGMPPHEASNALAGLLPNIIDKLTPNGQIPQELSGGAAGGLMDMLKNQFMGGQRQ